MSLTLILNGQSRAFDALPQPASLEQLIGELGLKGDRVAVEHNGEIVPRAVWAETTLNAGDRLEVVHFVGGGLGFGKPQFLRVKRDINACSSLGMCCKPLLP